DSAAISFLSSKESYELFSEVLATINTPQLVEAVESAQGRMDRRKGELIRLMHLHGVTTFTSDYYGDDPKVITLVDGEIVVSEVTEPLVDEIDEQLKDQDYPQLADLLSDLALSLYDADGTQTQTALPKEVMDYMSERPKLQWAFRFLHQMSLKLNEVGDGTDDNF
ncbi:MAG: hypothetical protein ACK456_10135, partial [Pseudanabaenaceae cyanobacterium]